jgi:diguanylate cyclase (GGDEF)-like protein
MRSRFDGTRQALRSPFPWAALAASLALTAAGWFGVEHARNSEARIQFERRTESAVAAVRARMLAYEQILRSGAARMSSSPTVSREEFRRFIANLQIEERFPGLQSIGFAEHLYPGTIGEHVGRLRGEGFRDYAIRPPGEREEYVAITYNEPFVGRNARLIGLDMQADDARREAMMQARDSGEGAITRRVLLAGETLRGDQPQQPGFVMFVPVFSDLARDLPRRERGNAISGYVFSPFRMQEIMRGILDEGVLQVVDMRVFDGTTRDPRSELLDTRTAWHAAPDSQAALFERNVDFAMPGRAWTIQFVSRPEFDRWLVTGRPWPLLAGGVLASLVVFMLVTALVEAWNRAHEMSMRDPLTGLYNRRYVEETMVRELPRARRLRQSIGVIVLDLDHFKQLNDNFGHDAGDRVLERMGELLRTVTRSGDIACRLGGEEFGVILPGATLEIARARAEAIRSAFSAMAIDFGAASMPTLTLSAGVTALAPHDLDWPRALRLADQALYTAKQAGRNRVIAAAED